MEKRRIRVLFLGHSDTPMAGHALYRFNEYPDDRYEKRLVVLDKASNGTGYGYFYDLKDKKDVWKKKILSWWQKIRILLSCGLPMRGIKENRGFNYYVGLYNNVSAEAILAKCPDFTPDLIVLMWVRTLTSPKTVRRLYELTGARFVFEFVDEAHLTGGCHYPIDCKEYLSGCRNCIALRWAKSLSAKTMSEKIDSYKGIPKYVVGTSFDCNLAKESILFKDSIRFLPSVSMPEVRVTLGSKARDIFGINQDSFVLLCVRGDARKGVEYGLEAVKKIENRIKNICLLLIGESDKSCISIDFNSNVVVKNLGYLSIGDLFTAFCASDCYLNTTIADSGPMMLNYASALGVPAVSFNIGVAVDLVIHKKTGYVAKWRDSSDFADGILFIYNLDIKERQVMRERCKSRIKDLSAQKKPYDIIYDEWDCL